MTSTSTRRNRVPLQVALIGYGLGGRAFHAPLIAVTAGLRLATIVTSNPDRKTAAAKDFPAARIVDSADGVWENAQAHDLVVITTPNRFHVPLARASIAARVPVVIDKPISVTAREARDLVAEAERANIPLAPYHNRRWDGEMLTAQKLIANGELGDVLRFESRLDRWRPAPALDVWRERGTPEDAGGVLYDLGPHLIDQARVLVGPVTQVYAELDRRRPGVAVFDDIFMALTHASGVHSHLWSSALAPQVGMRFRVLGTRAAYTKRDADVQEAALRSGHRPDEPGFGQDPEANWGLFGAGTEVRPLKTEAGNYKRFYELCVPWLRDGAPPPVAPADAIAVMDIIEASQRSAAEARVVTLPESV
jgi:predicted dehydrogenase